MRHFLKIDTQTLAFVRRAPRTECEFLDERTPKSFAAVGGELRPYFLGALETMLFHLERDVSYLLRLVELRSSTSVVSGRALAQ